MDNYVDLRQGKAKAIQDYINREEIMSLPLQNLTKIALDEKMRGHWLIRTSAFSEQEIAQVSESSPNGALDSLLREERSSRHSFRDGEKKFTMTVVNRKTEPVIRQAVLVITLTPSLTVRSRNQVELA